MRARSAVASLLAAVGLLLSLTLLSKRYGVALLGEAAMQACGAGGGCDAVDQSPWAAPLGIPLAAIGLFFYGSLLALMAPLAFGGRAGGERGEDPAGRVEVGSSGPAFVAFGLTALALAIDLVLLGVQALSIGAYCSFCLATYVVNGLVLATLWPSRLHAKDVLPGLGGWAPSWAVATLAVGVAVFATNAALAEKKKTADANILGAPAGVPTHLARPEPSPAPGDPLADARAEAAKWKATLDDPQKLQEYLDEKARDDFNAAPVSRIDLTRAPKKGAPNGPITVVEYADFMCPYCRDIAGAFSNYIRAPGNQVEIHFKHFPLDSTCNVRIGREAHPGSCDLSRAAICAADEGRFWEFHDQVFARTWDRAKREDVLKIAAAAGLDVARVSACMDSAATRGRLRADIDEAWRLGVGSTPTIFVNGRVLKTPSVFLLAVEEERKRLGLVQTPEGSTK